MKSGPRFLPAQRDRLLELVADLSQKYLHASKILEKLAEIAPEFADVTRTTINNYRVKARKVWQKNAAEKIDQIKMDELRQLYLLRQEAWEAYQRSVGRSRIITKEGKANSADGQLKGQKVTIREEDLSGDPAWMARLIEIHRRICDLMGIDSPQKLELEGELAVNAATEFIISELAGIAERTGQAPDHQGP